MDGCEDVRFKECAVYELLCDDKIPPLRQSWPCVGSVWEKYVDVSTVRRSVWQFKQEGREAYLCEEPRTGKPVTTIKKLVKGWQGVLKLKATMWKSDNAKL